VILNLGAEFQEQGYIILRNVLEPAVIDGVQAEMERLVDACARQLHAAGKITDLHSDEPFETRLHRLYRDRPEEAPKRFTEELHGAGMFPLFFHARLLDIVESFLGGEIRLYPNYTARPKFPDHEGHLVLWHQDGAYTKKREMGANVQVDNLRMMNVWTPLVPATVENGCMQFIPGTHKLGVVPHERRTHYLEIARDQLEPRLSQAVDIVMNPGDVVLFSDLLFHQGLPNRSHAIRWSIDWRYQDATQPTLRPERGHVARSRRDPSAAVQSAAQWVNLSFQ
jgi:phytanoyl-CoA hydroxylase